MAAQNATHRDLVNFEQYIIILKYSYVMGSVMSLFGVVSNIINIGVFIIMGLGDGMTVCFLTLSIFDLTYLCFSLSFGITIIFGVIELTSAYRFPVEPHAVSIFFANLMILINVTNVLTTTFLAVARCMCVAKPLHFKNSFTRSRTCGFLVGFAIFAVAIYSPVFSQIGITRQFVKKDNITRPTLWMSRSRYSIKVVIWVFLDMGLPIATEFIVLVCVLVMASSLRASSKFRQSTMLVPKKHDKKYSGKRTTKQTNKTKHPGASSSSSDKNSEKDIRVVQQVVLISLVYVICNTPKILTSVAVAIEPEYSAGGQLHNLFIITGILRKHFEVFNAAINTLIYYRYNRKFRAVMWRSVE